MGVFRPLRTRKVTETLAALLRLSCPRPLVCGLWQCGACASEIRSQEATARAPACHEVAWTTVTFT